VSLLLGVALVLWTAIQDLPVAMGWVILDGRESGSGTRLVALQVSTSEVAVKLLLGVTRIVAGLCISSSKGRPYK
jgi:hypothetical protein